MEEYWCVAVPGHNHYPQLAGRGVAVGGCSPRRFQPHQCLGQCCGSPGPHNGTYQKAAAPRSVGGGWYLVSSAGGRTSSDRVFRDLSVLDTPKVSKIGLLDSISGDRGRTTESGRVSRLSRSC
jgi:hypothetical protein